MANPFDFSAQEKASPSPRRPVIPQRPSGTRAAARWSIGGWIMLAGSAVGVLSAFLPGSITEGVSQSVREELDGGWVLPAALVALVVGGVWSRVRKVSHPSPAHYTFPVIGLIAGGVLALILGFSGLKVISANTVPGAAFRPAFGAYAVVLAGGVFGVGALVRFVEALLGMRKTT